MITLILSNGLCFDFKERCKLYFEKKTISQ